MTRLRKLVTPRMKEMILRSIPFRLYSRMQLKNPEIRVSVEVTTKCNCKCSMCTRERLVKQDKLRIGEIADKKINIILGEIKKFRKKGYNVAFTPMGLGEPLMYSKIFQVFEKVKKIDKNIKNILVTNGLLLNSKNNFKNVDEISISLNGRNRDEYKKLNGIDAFEVVVQNIKNLLKLKNRPNVFIQYLDLNKSDFTKVINEWNKLMRDGDKCYVHPIVNQAGLANKEKDLINYPCTQPLWRISIKINGDVYPCDPALYSGSNKFEELCLGNVDKMSIYETFIDKFSKRYQIFNEMRKNDYKNLECCKVCTTKCLGGNCYFNIGGIKINGYKWW